MRKYSRVLEFLQDGSGQFSMSRLLCLLSFFPAAYMVVTTRDISFFGAFLAAYTAGYVGGKVLGKDKNTGSISNTTPGG